MARKLKPTRGRPTLPADLRSRAVNTTLAPPTYRFCEKIGGGSASRGLRILADAAKNSSEKTPVS